MSIDIHFDFENIMWHFGFEVERQMKLVKQNTMSGCTFQYVNGYFAFQRLSLLFKISWKSQMSIWCLHAAIRCHGLTCKLNVSNGFETKVYAKNIWSRTHTQNSRSRHWFFKDVHHHVFHFTAFTQDLLNFCARFRTPRVCMFDNIHLTFKFKFKVSCDFFKNKK
jgi:hypothetical protein